MHFPDDLSQGEKDELIAQPKIEEYLGCDLEKLEQYDTFDFVHRDENIWVEYKKRGGTSYHDFMTPINKTDAARKGIPKGHRYYFVNEFDDGIFYFHFTGQDLPRRMGGRCDRGVDERKPYDFIPKKLCKLYK